MPLTFDVSENTAKMCTVNFPHAGVVILVDVALDNHVRAVPVAKRNFDPTLIGSMLDKLGNVLCSPK